MRAIVEQLLASADAESNHDLAHSDWLEDARPEEIEGLYDEFRVRYAMALEELVGLLSQPDRAASNDRAWFDTWFPEAMDAAAWHRGKKWLCLALAHGDRETPVYLALSSLTVDRLAELGG
jgi:hypothetical protein